MPGFPRWHPSDEPFSYTKLCYYYIPGLLLIVVLVGSFFWGGQSLDHLDKWLFSSARLGTAMGVLVVPVTYFLSVKLLWRLLPQSVRARIPYDAKEAGESKGDIRSFWDLRKLILPHH